MQYTPQQVMATVGISQQTLRYWRKVLPPLSDRDGYKACFSFADLVALKVTYLLANEAGVAVGTISKMSQAIFSACTVNAPLASGYYATLTICPGSGKVVRSPRDKGLNAEELEIVVPLGKCIEELLEALQESGTATRQFALPLPLAAVSTKGRRP